MARWNGVWLVIAIAGVLVVIVVLTVLWVRSGARVRSAEFYRLASIVLAALLALVVSVLDR